MAEEEAVWWRMESVRCESALLRVQSVVEMEVDGLTEQSRYEL